MKKRLVFLIVLLVVLCAVAAGILLWPQRGLRPGDKGQAVTNAQIRLREMQFTAESASGVYDAQTQEAVARFKARNGLPEGEGLDKEAQKLLFSEACVPSAFEIRFLDVGQGDSTLILCDGHAMLVDGGLPAASSKIFSILRDESIVTLDAVVCTHPDNDHVGGLPAAFQNTAVQAVYCSVDAAENKAYQSFVRKTEEQGLKLRIPSPGESFALGSAQVCFVGPYEPGKDANNTSLVLRVDYLDTSFLLTGDCEMPEEASLLEHGALLDADVLKVGHHGSEAGTGADFLAAVTPRTAVISVGRDNGYGHPTDAVLNHLQAAGAELYRTDLQGTITAVSNGREIAFSTEKNADARVYTQEPPPKSEAAAVTEGESTHFVLNIKSKKVHLPDCGGVSTMKPENREDFTGTLEEAMAKGYTPCGSCLKGK